MGSSCSGRCAWHLGRGNLQNMVKRITKPHLHVLAIRSGQPAQVARCCAAVYLRHYTSTQSCLLGTGALLCCLAPRTVRAVQTAACLATGCHLHARLAATGRSPALLQLTGVAFTWQEMFEWVSAPNATVLQALRLEATAPPPLMHRSMMPGVELTRVT